MSSVNLYVSVVFIHIIAATVLFGSSLFSPMLRRGLRRASTVGEARQWQTFEQRMTLANPIAALVLLASGLYLGSYGWWSYPWFKVAVGLFVADMVVAVVIVKGVHGRLAQALSGSAGSPLPALAERMRSSIALDLSGGFLLASDLAALYLMIRKPGLSDSLAAVVLALAVVGTVALIANRRHRGVIEIEPTTASASAVGISAAH